MKNVLEHLHSLSFHVPSFEPDGKLHRFGRNGSKDSAWYIAWQNSRLSNGEFYYVCSFGDWKTSEQHLYKPDKLSRADNVAIDEQIKSKQLEIQKARERVQLEVADKAERFFDNSSKEGVTPYMQRKKIPSLYGCGVYLDRLQVPMRDVEGMIWSMQTITHEGAKFFMKGGRKKECFHVIGQPISEEMIYVCEGFATGASIHQATGKTVVVAFDAGNLIDVVAVLVKTYPQLQIAVCGDDDRNNEANPGRKKAEKASLLSSGMVVFPKFPETDTKSTDFNDLHLLYGLDKVKEQIIGTPIEKQTGFIPLGYDESTHFFFHIPSKDIVKATTFAPMQMYRIAPLDYWEAHYPTKKGGTDIHRAAHDLIQNSSAVGPFDSTRIRGTGVWLDGSRVVINTGHSLIVDGKETALTSLASWHIYVQTRNRMPPMHPKPLLSKEGVEIARACRSFKWKVPSDAYLLSGWLMLARIAGAMPIRPHIWITGGKGTGKSTLMEQLIAPLLGGPKGKIHLIGATTEAGIRQAIRCSALPIIFDEFESTGKTSRDRVDSIIELLRNSWSSSGGKILKGSASGASVEYQLCFAALLSSIRVKLDNDADRSRFSVLELDEHGDSDDQWKQLRKMLASIDEELGERLFARAAMMVKEIIASQIIIARYLARAVSQRYGQQVGTLLAAWWCLEHNYVITDLDAQNLCKDFVDDVGDDAKQELSDQEECLLVLMTKKITLRTETGAQKDMSIADAIKDDYWHSALRTYGIKCNGTSFSIANNHSVLESFYRGTRWDGNWSRSLRRLTGSELTRTSFGSRDSHSRCVSLPISLAKSF